MANEQWIKTLTNVPMTSTGQGTGTNDGWQILARYPGSKLPLSTTQRLAVYVKTAIGQVVTFGAWPARGMMQLCLGLDTGLQSTKHRTNIPIGTSTWIQGIYSGQQVSFLMVQQASPSLSDSDFGATLNTTAWAGTVDLVLWGRAYKNGDTTLYGCNFKVMDTQWIVMDMDALEADSRVRAAENTTPATVGTAASPNTLLHDASNIGSAGQRWLTFGSIDLTTRWMNQTSVSGYPNSSNNATTITWGYYDGTPWPNLTDRLRIAGNCASASQLTGVVESRLQVGGFFTHTIASGTQQMMIEGKDQFGHPNNPGYGAYGFSTANRTATLTIRVDDLPLYAENVTVADPEVGKVSNSLTPTYNGQTPGYFPIVVESPIAAVTWNPVILMCGIVADQGSTSVHQPSGQVRIRNSTGNILHVPQVFLSQLWYQRMPCQSFYQQVMSADQVYQLAMDMYQTGTSPADVHDACLLMFHDTINVTNNAGTPKWANMTPIPITITAEGPVVGSMNALPIAPEVSMQQTVEAMQFGQVKSSQGYRRSWPTWVKPRRGWQLGWNGISAADATTLRTFLDVNDSFAFTPQGSLAALPVTITSEVSSDVLSDGRQVIQVQVVELLFTA